MSTSATDTPEQTAQPTPEQPSPQPSDIFELLQSDLESLPPTMRASAANRLRERGLLRGANQAPEAPSSPEPEHAPEPVAPAPTTARMPEATEPPQTDGEPPVEPAADNTLAAQIEQMKQQLDLMREQLRTAEARYSTLRGKYDAETAELRRQIAMLQTIPAPSTPATAPPSSTQTYSNARSIKEQLVSRYGQDFDETTVNFVADAVELARARMLEEMQRHLTDLQNVAMNSQQQALEVQLDNRIPGWREVAQDPRFAAWLDEPDPFSGLVRRDVLSKAIQGGHTDRIVTVFDTFRRTQTAELPVTSPVAAQASLPNGTDVSAGTAPPSRPRASTVAVPSPRPRGSVAATPAVGQSVVTPAMLENYKRRAMRGEATEEEYRALHDAIVSGNYLR